MTSCSDQSAVERVAVALRTRCQDLGIDIAGPLIEGGAFPALARAAIEAMRAPTEAMITALAKEGWEDHPRARAIAARDWDKAIDAALAETP